MRRKKNPSQRKATATETVKKVRSSTSKSISDEMSQSEKTRELSVNAPQSTATSSSYSQASPSPPHVQNTSLHQVNCTHEGTHRREAANWQLSQDDKDILGRPPPMVLPWLLDRESCNSVELCHSSTNCGQLRVCLEKNTPAGFWQGPQPAILEQVEEQDVIEQENVLKIEWYRANNKRKPSGKSKETDQKKEGNGESSKEKPRNRSKTGPRITVETDADKEEKEGDEEEEEPDEEEKQEESNGVTDVEEDNEKDRKKTRKKVGKTTEKRVH